MSIKSPLGGLRLSISDPVLGFLSLSLTGIRRNVIGPDAGELLYHTQDSNFTLESKSNLGSFAYLITLIDMGRYI